ncbi:hypothetical protein BC835DRAFT_1355101 [Cytidiella melzeri]|nr:hypothetical protein BC835DRAFT_1355101 [Cytidiella melzeri]
MPLFGHKNKDKHVNEFDTSGRQGLMNNDSHGNNQMNDSAMQQSGLNQPSSATGNQAGMGAGAGHHHHHHHDGQQYDQQQGPIVGAASVREQAMHHDRIAQNFHEQSEELARAEKLEAEARKHRELAVAQGAHPHNKVLGVGEGMTSNQAGTGQRTDF